MLKQSNGGASISRDMYVLVEKLGVINKVIEGKRFAKSVSGSYMDLSLNVLANEGRDECMVSLSNHYLLNGDVCEDVAMEIMIDMKNGVVESMVYRMSVPYVNQRVYSNTGRANLNLKKELNSFLFQWLTQCVDQGHSFSKQDAYFEIKPFGLGVVCTNSNALSAH